MIKRVSVRGHKGAPSRPGAPEQRGVALLQALLLSMVIALLLLQLVFAARGQLRVAAEIEERVAADLLLYSARSEALFSLLVDPSSIPTDALSLVPLSGVNRALVSFPSPETRVAVKLHDVSGLLPLRFPRHPLWPPVLAQLGLDETAATSFLEELNDMQDRDFVTTRSIDEPQQSSVGFVYPNVPMQSENSLTNWVTLDVATRERILGVSHHYGEVTVNLEASPSLVVDAALGEPGQRTYDISDTLQERYQLKEFLEGRYQELVTAIIPSGTWRLDVEVRGDVLTRRARYDFYVNASGPEPFIVVGR